MLTWYYHIIRPFGSLYPFELFMNLSCLLIKNFVIVICCFKNVVTIEIEEKVFYSTLGFQVLKGEQFMKGQGLLSATLKVKPHFSSSKRWCEMMHLGVMVNCFTSDIPQFFMPQKPI